MSAPLRVLIVTDAFPPVCGGSGWSTFELARGLVARGHHVEVVKTDTKEKTGIFQTSISGLPEANACTSNPSPTSGVLTTGSRSARRAPPRAERPPGS